MSIKTRASRADLNMREAAQYFKAERDAIEPIRAVRGALDSSSVESFISAHPSMNRHERRAYRSIARHGGREQESA